MSNRLAVILIIAATLLCLTKGAQAVEDFQYRQGVYVRALATTNWALTTWGELRWVDDASKLTNWRVGQQVRYSTSSNLTFGVGYTYIRQDGLDIISGRQRDIPTQRAELDVIPQRQLDEDTRFDCRLRFENRWVDGVSSWNPFFRARPEFVFAVHGLGPLVEIFTQNEFLFDLKRDRYAENRFVPVGLTFQVSHQVRWRLFYMLDSVHTVRHWDQLNVLQTQLLLNL